MSLTRGQIFSVVNAERDNSEEHKKYFNELWDNYGYLAPKLPAKMREALDKIVSTSIGMETQAMEIAYYQGRNSVHKEAALNG